MKHSLHKFLYKMNHHRLKLSYENLKFIYIALQKLRYNLLYCSSFVHNSSISELKNMKLSEHICYEMIN